MDDDRFDSLIYSLTRTGSRRTALRVLSTSAIASVLGLLGSGTARATHTPGDCRHNGVRCTTGTQCCSGRCVRKRGTTKKFCRAAPGQGICTIEENVCVTGASVSCADGLACTCLVTSRSFSFCAQNADFDCSNCTSDADCVNRPGGVGQAGDRCVQAGTRCCADPDVDRMCVHKCPDPDTA